MKKKISRILIVVGQSLMLLYFAVLTYQGYSLKADIMFPWYNQVTSIVDSMFVFALLSVAFMVFALVQSCRKMPLFWLKRGNVTVINGLAAGLAAFGLTVVISFDTQFFIGMGCFLVFAVGYTLSLIGIQTFYKKRMEADKIQKSTDGPEVKLAKFHALHERGYLSDEEMNKLTSMLTHQD